MDIDHYQKKTYKLLYLFHSKITRFVTILKVADIEINPTCHYQVLTKDPNISNEYLELNIEITNKMISSLSSRHFLLQKLV